MTTTKLYQPGDIIAFEVKEGKYKGEHWGQVIYANEGQQRYLVYYDEKIRGVYESPRFIPFNSVIAKK